METSGNGLLVGQVTLGEALEKALPPLLDESIRSMEERERAHAAWKKARAAKMDRKTASIEQFDVRGDEVRHLPTNCTFTAYLGGSEIGGATIGNLYKPLPNGDDYNEESVWAMARELMKNRPRC